MQMWQRVFLLLLEWFLYTICVPILVISLFWFFSVLLCFLNSQMITKLVMEISYQFLKMFEMFRHCYQGKIFAEKRNFPGIFNYK